MSHRASGPSVEDFRGFLLGSLPPDAAERVVAWVEEEPAAADVLGELRVADTLVDALASATKASETAPLAVERIVRGVSRAIELQLTTSFAPPTSEFPCIDGFEIRGVLGRGGMGEVYKAFDTATGQAVAIKMPLSRDPNTLKRFQREGEAAKAIDSKHAVKIYAVGATERSPYLVMEYLEGSTLKLWKQARHEPVAADDLLWIARDALTGLAAIHAAKIIHRDIKPENLWIEQGTGWLKVMDFGLARKATGEDDLTKTGVVLGSMAYMSPEQGAGKPLDFSTDLYSLGVVLYKLIVPNAPFNLGHYHGAIPGNPPPLTAIPTALSQFIVTRLLAQDPSQRPANGEAALEELRLLEQQLQSVAETRPERRGPNVRNRRWILAGLVPLLALVLGGVILIVRFKDGTEVRVESPDNPGKIVVTNSKTKERVVVDMGSTAQPPPPVPQKGGPAPIVPLDPTKIVVGSQIKVKPRVNEGSKVMSYDNETLNQSAKVLDPDTIGQVQQISGNAYRIEILSGPLKGETVWVSGDFVELSTVR